MKDVSLCFEVCYPQRKALSVKKSKAKSGKIRQVSQDIRHLHEIPWGKGFWDTIRSYPMFTSDMRLVICTCDLQVGLLQKYKSDSCKSFIKFDTYSILHG